MEFFQQMLPYLVAILSAVCSYLVSKIRTEELSHEIKTIQEYLETSDNEYFINCPQCQYKIKLEEVRIHAEKKEEEKEKK